MTTFRQKANLLRGVLSRRFAFAGPFAVTVDVTSRCNLRCLGCSTHSPYINRRTASNSLPEDLDIDLFERLCRELQEMGTHTLVLCGDGEPLLHRQLLHIIRMAKRSGFRTVLLTNGTLIDETKARALVETGIDLVRISLWAATAEDYKSACPNAGKDYFSSTVSAARHLTSARDTSASPQPCVALHLILNRYSARSMDPFLDLVQETRCDSVSFSPLHTLFGQLDSFGLTKQEERVLDVRLSYAKKKLRALGLEHNIDEILKRYEVGADVRQKVPCYIGWMQCRVKTDGTVQPCNPCRWQMGNIRERSLREIWTDPAYEAFRNKIMSPENAAEIDERCDCSFCCFLGENLRVHTVYRWFAPFSTILGRWIQNKKS